MNKLTDQEVMMRVKEGKIEMLAILFERHHVKLYNFLLRLSQDRTASEDMVQDIFFRILKYRTTYRGESKFIVWLYQIARNIHVDYLRKYKKEFSIEEKWGEEIDPGFQPSEKMEHAQDLKLLHAALNKLPLKKKELLVLSRFQNLKYREIAELCQCSIESVKTTIHRAIKELRNNYINLQGGLL